MNKFTTFVTLSFFFFLPLLEVFAAENLVLQESLRLKNYCETHRKRIAKELGIEDLEIGICYHFNPTTKIEKLPQWKLLNYQRSRPFWFGNYRASPSPQLNPTDFHYSSELSCRYPVLSALYAFLHPDNKQFLKPLESPCEPATDILVWGGIKVDAMPLKIDKISEIHYLVADEGDAFFQGFGHSGLRLVVCGPNDTTAEQCRLNFADDWVVHFAAFMEGAGVNAIKGLNGSYPMKVTLMPFKDYMRRYRDVQGRSVWSYPLDPSRINPYYTALLALRLYYDFNSSYYFLTQNCASEIFYLLASINPEITMGDPDIKKPFNLLKLLRAHRIIDPQFDPKLDLKQIVNFPKLSKENQSKKLSAAYQYLEIGIDTISLETIIRAVKAKLPHVLPSRQERASLKILLKDLNQNLESKISTFIQSEKELKSKFYDLPSQIETIILGKKTNNHAQGLYQKSDFTPFDEDKKAHITNLIIKLKGELPKDIIREGELIAELAALLD